MSCLLTHGPINCIKCCPKASHPGFNEPVCYSSDGDWRIRSNPLAWGSPEPEILVLGFSKGQKQVCALKARRYPHEEIAFRGSLPKIGQILAHIEVVDEPEDGKFGKMIYRHICDRNGRFHFGSLVRCSVERKDDIGGWKGRHGNLGKFLRSEFGKKVAGNCASQFLGTLPAKTKLVIMFGCSDDYVHAVRELVENTRRGNLDIYNEIAYTDGKVMFVHVVHFTAYPKEISNWLGKNDSPAEEKGRKGRLAKEAVHLNSTDYGDFDQVLAVGNG